MADKIGIEEQIKHIEDALRSSKAFVALTERYVAQGERPQEVLEEAKRRVPYWEAALETLRWVGKNRDVIISVYRQKKP